jgi:hypothetical protein
MVQLRQASLRKPSLKIREMTAPPVVTIKKKKKKTTKKAAAADRHKSRKPSLKPRRKKQDEEEEEESDEEEEEETKKKKRKAGTQAEKGKKKKKRKTGTGGKKKKKGEEEEEEDTTQQSLFFEVFTHPQLLQDLCVNPKWLATNKDLKAVGATCKALSDLCVLPESMNVDLKKNKLRFPHRFVVGLSGRPGSLLKSLQLSRIPNPEICDEVKTCLASGNMVNLEELVLEGAHGPKFKDLFVSFTTAPLPALRSLTIRDIKIGNKSRSWKHFKKTVGKWLATERSKRRQDQKKKEQEKLDKKRGMVTDKKKKRKMKPRAKKPVVSPVLHLESLNLEGLYIPRTSLERWIEGLHLLNHRVLRKLTLIGLRTGLEAYDKLAETIKEGHLRQLEAIHIDTARLSDETAADLIGALDVGCDRLLELQLGNRTGKGPSTAVRRVLTTTVGTTWERESWGFIITSSSGELLVAKLMECADGGGLQSLEVLTIIWKGFTQSEELVTFLFGEEMEGSDEEVSPKELPFPNLYSFGLQGMGGKVTGPFLCRVLKACVAHGILQVDFRYNGLKLESCSAIVDAAKELMPQVPRGELLHLHLAQFRQRRPKEVWDERRYVRPYWGERLPRSRPFQSYDNLPKGLHVYVEKPWVD